jgi:hypothetical protein
MTSYAIADDVAWVSREDLDGGENPVAYVASLPHGPTLVLEGPACLVWLLVAEGGTLDDIARGAGAQTDLATDQVIDDVEILLNELVEAGVVRAH